MNKKGFIFSFLLFVSCFFVIGNVKASDEINYHNYTIDDTTYDIIWSQLEGKTIHEIMPSINSDEVLHRADFPYVQVYGNTSTGSSQYIYFNFLKDYHIGCPGTNVLAYPSLGEVRYFCNQKQPYFNQYWVYATIKVSDNTLYGYGVTNGIFTAHTQNDNRQYYQGLFNFDVYTVNHILALAKNYEYDVRPKIYNTNNIDYIEYKFDNLPLQETELHIDYTFKSVTSDGQDDTIDFSAPFARDTYTGCDDLGGNCTIDEKYKDLLMYPIGTTDHIFQGSGNHILNSSPEHITNSFSIIIPFEYSLGSYVALDFDANLDYEMIIHYKDDENSVNSYIGTVDITGKYGAIFLPKYDDSNYVDSDSYYLTNFRIVGNVDVQVTDSRDMNNYNIQQIYSMNYCNTVYSNQTEIPYNCDNQSGIFSFRIDNLRANQTLRFVNHSYTEMSDRRTLIEYDTRFFNYGILDEPTSVVQIEDPTTHVVETVGLSDFYNQLNEENIGKSKITFKSAFNRFVSPIKFIFRTITNLYNNYLSSSVQHYFFLVFCLMILLLLIRVIF